MTYKKQQWKTGEIITEGKLNHVEDGIYNTDNDLTESKTLFANNILDLQTNKANQSDVVSINQEIDNISADLAAAEADITTKAAQADVDTISNEVDTLQTQVTTNTNNIKSLQDNAVNKSELDAKQDKLTAGSNITIVGNVISATTSGGGGGDVTLAGDNSFTGNNTFDGETTFNGHTWAAEQEVVSLNVTSNATLKNAYITGTISSLGELTAVSISAAGIKNNQNNKYYLNQASITAGNNVTVEETTDGIKISSTDTQYTLPIASSTTLGGIKVGDNLSISDDGTLNATGSGSAPDNMVTTDTDQTISGQKWFLKKPKLAQGLADSNGNSILSLSSSLYFGRSTLPMILQGTKITNDSGDIFLTQNNVTAGNNISIENTDTGIKINSTSSGGITTAEAAQAAMPSDNYIDISVGGNGQSYTAPADGYLFIYAHSTSNSNTAAHIKIDDKQYHLTGGALSGVSGSIVIPMYKGKIFYYNYQSNVATEVFRFYYAKGAK